MSEITYPAGPFDEECTQCPLKSGCPEITARFPLLNTNGLEFVGNTDGTKSATPESWHVVFDGLTFRVESRVIIRICGEMLVIPIMFTGGRFNGWVSALIVNRRCPVLNGAVLDGTDDDPNIVGKQILSYVIRDARENEGYDPYDT